MNQSQTPDMLLSSSIAKLSLTISEICRISSTAGLSLGVLHLGEVIHTSHYGYRDVATSTPPNNDTVFYIASLTKAITAAAVGILVEQKKVEWETPISAILPEFQRSDAVGGATLLDVMSHRTGLAGANALWIQRNQHFYMGKDETINTVNHLKAVKPFRESFHYSNWGYGLATEVIERITGQTYGEFVAETIFKPLNMTRTTVDIPQFEDGNVASAYAVKNDGTVSHIPPPPQSDETGLAGAGGVKSTVNDLLRMYKSMLSAYKHQVQTKSTSTPDTPFKQMATIFEPKIAIGENNIEDESYTLGWVRSKLPRGLGNIGMNEYYLGGQDKMPIIGNSSPGTVVFHHDGSLVGMLSSVHLIPETETAIIVMTNSVPFTDPPDWVGQLIVETILGEKQPHDYIALSNKAKEFHFTRFPELKAEIEKGKTGKPPTNDILAYEGKYYNEAHNFVLEVVRNGDGLKMISQGFSDAAYELRPYDGDTFYWSVDREEEMVHKCMFPWLWPGLHKVTFESNGSGNFDRLAWLHDPAQGLEYFTKSSRNLIGQAGAQNVLSGTPVP